MLRQSQRFGCNLPLGETRLTTWAGAYETPAPTTTSLTLHTLSDTNVRLIDSHTTTLIDTPVDPHIDMPVD